MHVPELFFVYLSFSLSKRDNKTYCPTHTGLELSHSDCGCCRGLKEKQKKKKTQQ